jgi:hypothetical protein
VHSCPHSTACRRVWRLWPGFSNRNGDHSWRSSVRSVEAAKPPGEVAVPKADSLVGGDVFLDRLDPLLYKQLMKHSSTVLSAPLIRFFRICRHLPTAAGSLLEAQSVHPQAPILPVGPLVSLPKLWHFNGARILALRNQQFWEGLHVIVERRFFLFKHLVLTNDLDFAGYSCFDL